jgi:hypothetical protein
LGALFCEAIGIAKERKSVSVEKRGGKNYVTKKRAGQDPRKNKQCIRNYCPGQKLSLARPLAEAWQDLQDDSQWKYEQLSPVQLLEKWGLYGCAAHNDELARANWFWNRRQRLLHTTSCIVWIIVALGLPLRLFIFPAIGVPLLIIAAEIVNTEIVRSAPVATSVRIEYRSTQPQFESKSFQNR